MLTIYLLTHNRTQLALKAIRSILAQVDKRFNLIVSDNSDSDELKSLIDDCSDLTYIKRPKVLAGIDHGNLCLSEIKTEYFVLFHDDDVMLPNFVASFWKARTRFPDAVAFGANAQIKDHGLNKSLSFKAASDYIGPMDANDLLRRYFSHHQMGIAPFPSYIYRRASLGNLRLDVTGGKYSDVRWLVEWAKLGSMIWISEPMMVYQLHASNDGNVESRHDRLRFLAFLKSPKLILNPEILSDYRNFLYKKLLSNAKKNGNVDSSYRHHLMSRFVVNHRYQRIFRFSFYKALIKKLATRFLIQFCKKGYR